MAAVGVDMERHLIELGESEMAAEDVLTDRQTIVDLDRKRNKTREALRSLQKDKETEKTWLCMGNMFLKLPKPKAKEMLQKDFDQLDEEINKLRKNLKIKVDKLRDIEQEDSLKGFHLQPLSKEELKAIDSVL
ncbi:unnamed protein product [Owenia fusiformis]|uniref:p53 and DNA damage-regulated protein 1 n=1 Tax=Owenia fusiformis TaxID=6347 RepID=A0A8J1UKM0_OWEFU|nr:unnamed protein product [Owenia fusiformis]